MNNLLSSITVALIIQVSLGCDEPNVKYATMRSSHYMRGGKYPTGSAVWIKCWDGYEMKGNEKLNCDRSNNWDADMPMCIKPCAHPRTFFGGKFYPDKAGYKYDDKVYYGCPGNRGKHIYSTCQMDGKWKQASKCYDYCKMMKMDYGKYEPMKEQYYYGEKITFMCPDKYYKYYEGEKYDHMMCGDNGMWDRKAPMCKKHCSAPDHMMYYHKSYAKKMYMHGDKIYYYCKDGYKKPERYGYVWATCMKDGNWDNMPYKCESEKKCMAPKHMDYNHMAYAKKMYKKGEYIKFMCMDGYRKHAKYDYEKAMCKEDGKWDKSPYKCMKYCEKPMIDHGMPEPYKKHYYNGDKVSYKCKEGYMLFYDGPWYEYATCMDNGMWDFMPPRCIMKQVTCKKPDFDGMVMPMKKKYQKGERISFKCKGGHTLFFDKDWFEYATCKNDGNWDFEAPKCRPMNMKYCMPSMVEHGYHFPDMKMYMKGDRMYHRCKEGYGLFFETDWYEYRTCGKDGKWDFDPPKCKSMKHSSGSGCMGHDVMHGKRRPNKSSYMDGDKVYYDCEEGYEKHYDMEAYEYAMCKNGMWNHSPPMCKSMYKNYCYPPKIMHGMYYPDKMRYNYGDRLRFKCKNGYGMYYSNEKYEYATCGRDGNWDKKPPMCKSHKMDYCDPPKFEHGMYTPAMKMYSSGDRLYYTKCKEGYMLMYGEDWFEYNVCMDDGNWKFVHPTCKMATKAYCDPPMIEHGMAMRSKPRYGYGEKVSYKCKDGYKLYYEGERYDYAMCKPGGYWDKKPPMCKRMMMMNYCYAPEFYYGSYWPMFERYQQGSKLYYRCARGFEKMYKGEEYEYNVCMDGKWKYKSPKCMDMKKKYCKMPKFEHGTLKPDRKMYSVGDQLRFKCNDGYYKYYEGKYYRYATCGKDGMWDMKPPMCKKIKAGSCMHMMIQHGVYSPMKGSYKPGDRVYYRCAIGYRLKYEDDDAYVYNYCGRDGKWNKKRPKCMKIGKKYCSPPMVEHGYYEPKMKYYDTDDQIYVKCEAGYYKYDEGMMMKYYSSCMLDGNWDELPKCKRMPTKYCKVPDHHAYNHRAYYKMRYMEGEYIKFECDYGYYAPANYRKHAKCMKDGNWGGAPQKCKKYCMGDDVMHGYYYPMKMYYRIGERVQYRCKSTYQMSYRASSYSYMTCMDGGNWDNKAPMCNKNCMIPRPYSYAYYYPLNKYSYSYGEKIMFYCSRGYRLNKAYQQVSCGRSGKWMAELPKCVRY